MKLAAKINSKYLDEILAGKKTMEFRQFDGKDTMELTDENGRTETVRIERASEAGEEFERTIKSNYRNLKWLKDEPIIVFHVRKDEK
jgi:hypothetical protein